MHPDLHEAKGRMRQLSIVVPIYCQRVVFLVGPRKDYECWVKKTYEYATDDRDLAGECIVLKHTTTKEKHYIVWLKTFDWYVSDMAVLAHEVMHLTDFFCQQVGIKPDEVEPRGYLHEYLMKTALTWLKPKQHRKKKRR